MKTKKKLAIIVVSLVLALGICVVASAAVTSGQPAQVGNLYVSGKIVATPTNVVYCCTNTPTFTGVTAANTTVAFTINSTPVTFSATTDANGNFSATSPALESGQHTVYVVVTDDNGSSDSTLIATININCDPAAAGLTSTGTMIAKIALVAIAVFMVLFAGYFALKKKEVKA